MSKHLFSIGSSTGAVYIFNLMALKSIRSIDERIFVLVNSFLIFHLRKLFNFLLSTESIIEANLVDGNSLSIPGGAGLSSFMLVLYHQFKYQIN